ncbi:MAG: FHA domain-containing protein [Acidobacteria bacterium]|nr:FHA domain-containing protein [Acidobacteriota bacterium]
MAEKQRAAKKGFTPDWLLRGLLTKVGDTVDRFTGRRWIPSSSIATSELIERIKKLIDAEAKDVPGKGIVVPHNFKLKMQWDKFSTDAEEALRKLENELLVATVDHINDSLYYTYAPVELEVKPDYFIEGVKLQASFDKFTEEDRDVEMNVTVPAINVAQILAGMKAEDEKIVATFIARFSLNSVPKEVTLDFKAGESISVGRTGSNKLTIDDNSVSKIHGSLSVAESGNLAVADTGSTNGTFINDVRIAYGKATELEPDDKVKFGTVEVTFENVPLPVEIESADEDEIDHTGPTEEAIDINGFEFRSRVSPEAPPSETSPAIPMPSGVLSPAALKEEEADPATQATIAAVKNIPGESEDVTRQVSGAAQRSDDKKEDGK